MNRGKIRQIERLWSMIFVDYWVCDNCESNHYGMCLKCGKCGRKFDENGICENIEEYPTSEEY